MRTLIILAAVAAFVLVTSNGARAEALAKGLYAIFHTNQGDFTVALFPDKAPKTVENFVGLATGTKEYKDAKSGEKKKGHYYDGLTFHRVIPNFMIQGGCPLGTGTGGPGYQFADEFDGSVKFSKPGLLAMANAGPNTNGSQFFVTVKETPWLNGKHTIFGEVVSGYEIVEKISKVSTGAMDRPAKPVVIEKLEIKKVD
ncbi:MAG: peptidylprolyl isomerase [Deltaproteobacteria bacterium]|nr:peptidylprolyl isomerase [Deltaproteobacteria bacterium]